MREFSCSGDRRPGRDLDLAESILEGAVRTGIGDFRGMPAGPAHIFARRYRFRVAALPFAVPAFEVSQYWHSRFDGDPGVKWLVETGDSLFGGD